MSILKTIKDNTFARLILLSIFLVIVNLISSRLYWRIDLTQDKRFTLSEVTHKTFSKIDNPLTINVFVDEDVNPGFRRLYKSIEYMLMEMKHLNRKNIRIEMVHPNKMEAQEKEKFNTLCQKHSMLPINIVEQDNSGKMTQKSIFPWMLIAFNKKELPINLLDNIPGKSGEENLNISIENLEYKILDGVRILTIEESERIAFIEGHDEWDEDQVYDITTALSRYFSVDRGRIGKSVEVLLPYKALIIAAPKLPFTEIEKFILDQYVMNGGKILWFLDGVKISADSLQNESVTMGLHNNLNLEDQLFTYGVRINPNLVLDLQCARYPVNIAPMGAEPDFKPVPWYYAPLFTTSNQHPISKNINPVKGEFVSTLSMVSLKNAIKRTTLLATGKQTQLIAAPALVNMNIVMEEPNLSLYTIRYQPVAVLLEGEFPSAFLNRLPPKEVSFKASAIKSISKPTKMLVVADGDLLKNDVQLVGNNRRIFPLGFDKITGRELYGNKSFIMNAVNFITDEQGILDLRNRNIPLRLLDQTKANTNRFIWQFLNVALPLALLFVFAIIFTLYRKKKNQ